MAPLLTERDSVAHPLEPLDKAAAEMSGAEKQRSAVGARGHELHFTGAVNAVVEEHASALSQRFVDKVFLMQDGSSQPRQGRDTVAQGESPGLYGPHPAFGTPLPRGRERGEVGEGLTC